MEHAFNAVWTVLGGLIAGLVGWLLESRRRKYDAILKHFGDIKRECLEPLRQELSKLCTLFGYVEGYPPPYRVDDIVSGRVGDLRYWANYSFRNFCNKVLYDDLVSHFPSLSKALTELEEEIRAGVPELFKALKALYTSIYSDEELVQVKICLYTLLHPDEELAQLMMRVKARGLQLDPEDLEHIIFLVAVGVEESRWPPTYREIIDDPKIADRLVKIGERLRGSREAKRVCEISESVLTKAKRCLNEIEKIMVQTKLRGKCPYV